MKKWAGYTVWIMIVLGLTGCGPRETGSALLTEMREAVDPVTEAVEPAAEETAEGTALHVYCGDEHAENIVQQTIYVDDADEQTVMKELVKVLGIDDEAGLKGITFGTHGGDRVAMVDLNQAFADYLNKLGTAGEYIVMGSLVNTFLDCYQCDLMLVTAEGRVLKTGHSVYEEYLEMYPYVAAAYRVCEEKLTEKGVEICYPRIEGLGDERIQEKWNRIIRENEERSVEGWEGSGIYQVSYTVKTQTADVLSILLDGYVHVDGAAYPSTFQYTYNIDLNTGASIRLADHVDVDRVAENMFEGKGYYVDETLAEAFRERLESIYESPDALARSLEGYDYSEDGSAPYGYSYVSEGKVWLCMEVPHSLGDYIEIELDTF